MNLTHNSGSMQRRLPIVQELPLRPQDETECRRCGVHCDKVVYPAACVRRSCPFVYAYEEWGHTYIGCMQKVYDVEIDLDALEEAQKRKGGFGAVKTVRQPLPMCKAEVATCYEHRADELGCVNPEFFELVGIRSMAVRARDLEDRRQPLQVRVAEEDAHALGDLALAEVRVPVAVRAERGGGVVHVQRPQPVEADPLLDLVDAGVQRSAVRDV